MTAKPPQNASASAQSASQPASDQRNPASDQRNNETMQSVQPPQSTQQIHQKNHQQHRGQRQILFWLTIAVLFSLAILFLREILLPFVAGLVLAYALDPLVGAIEKLRIGRLASSAIVVALLVVIFIVVLVFLVPLLVDQARELVASAPSEFERLRPKFEAWAREQLGTRFGDVSEAINQVIARSENWAGIAGSVAQSLLDQGRTVISILSILFITPIVVFYLLVDWPQMMRRLGEWLPRDHETTLRRLAGEIDEAISAFVRGQGIVCLVLGTLYSVGLSSAGLNYGLLIGICTGVMTFVPVVGTVLGLITASTVAIMQGWPDLTLLATVVAIFAAGQALDSGFLSPRVVGAKIGLHPVALIFALVVFSYLFGFVGVLVAVPMAAAAGVLIRYSLELYLASSYYKGTAQGDPSQEHKQAD